MWRNKSEFGNQKLSGGDSGGGGESRVTCGSDGDGDGRKDGAYLSYMTPFFR